MEAFPLLSSLPLTDRSHISCHPTTIATIISRSNRIRLLLRRRMAPIKEVVRSEEEALSLNYIRTILQRLEDTILFQLIERGQNAHNAVMYEPGAIPALKEKEGWEKSWVEWFLKETESSHSKLRRWQAPDEYPFTDMKLLPAPILPPIEYPKVLYEPAIVNVNDQILSHYKDHLVPTLTKRFGSQSDDGQYGSAAVRDVDALAALSKRIHFGMFVSESKFRSDTPTFVKAIQDKDSKKLEALITKPEVEAALLVRLEGKAKVYGQDLNSSIPEKDLKIDPDVAVQLYRDFVIPLTKVVEVDYLLKR